MIRLIGTRLESTMVVVQSVFVLTLVAIASVV
ncbi:hypothetical protein HAINFHK1212_1679, partial [Haemophilus influenzae HK1212]